MAGSLAIVEAERHGNEDRVSSIQGQWQVHFARFIVYQSLPAIYPPLVVPLTKRQRCRSRGGNWIATSFPVASLHIINGLSRSEAILTVSLSGKILMSCSLPILLVQSLKKFINSEEHHISKLHFSWPQIQCIPEIPARGSRAVFVSYKDCADEIQKFALRFSTHHEAVSFMNTLQEKFKGKVEIEPLNTDFGSDFSLQLDFISSNELPSRANQELSDLNPEGTCTPQMSPSLSYEIGKQSVDQDAKLNNNSDGSYTPEMSPSLNYEIRQQSVDQDVMLKNNSDGSYAPQMSPSLNYEIRQQLFDQYAMINNNSEGILQPLPPSFTSLLTNCCPTAEKATNQPRVSEEIDLKSQIVVLISNYFSIILLLLWILQNLEGKEYLIAAWFGI
ncbi:Poor ous synapsis 1, putative isoform 4 [Hibiscus syriacus]|uniref:Poor ous synapsis 1, putative isoform 4 n=1 Tax=Hibiscus syriacus TaxID=106335 RepID=A0A6A2Z8P2_HIBSY|nr:Poor ous synapsis 1, putative isoform 4 [Hibiscus syriacus]